VTSIIDPSMGGVRVILIAAWLMTSVHLIFITITVIITIAVIIVIIVITITIAIAIAITVTIIVTNTTAAVAMLHDMIHALIGPRFTPHSRCHEGL